MFCLLERLLKGGEDVGGVMVGGGGVWDFCVFFLFLVEDLMWVSRMFYIWVLGDI